MASEKGAYTIQVVNKAFEILNFLSECPSDAHLQAIASKAQLTRNNTFRLLATLCESGLVEYEKASGNYMIGTNSFSLGQKLIKNSSVICIAHPVIEHLARKYDEAVYMAIIKGDDVLFLDMADCNRQIKAEPLIGKSFPYFTNAAGKVIKALETRELPEWLSQKKRGSIKNVPDPEKLASELLEIRSNGGMAIDCDGLGEGISSVAVAVKDYAGKVIGAITVLGPSFRMVKERIENEILPSLIEGASLISERFGYMPA